MNWIGLGGGIVPGSILLGGEPTLEKVRFAANSLKLPYKTLYVSGEESQKQIKNACRKDTQRRIAYILTETRHKTSSNKSHSARNRNYNSIQTLHTDYIEPTPGSISN
jgi:DNA repair protein RadA/Sms